jgi:hypothetical protein
MQKIAYDALDEVPSTEAFILKKQAEAVQAIRRAISSSPEIPDNSGSDSEKPNNSEGESSRQALEGEAIGEVGYMIQPNWDDPSKTKGVALVDKSLAPGTKLYTHPASKRICYFAIKEH